MELTITHNKHDLRFETIVDGKEAHVIYRHFKDGDKEGIKITSTYVPPELEGRGIAAALTKAAVDYAIDMGIRVIPVCSYAVAYFKRKGLSTE